MGNQQHLRKDVQRLSFLGVGSKWIRKAGLP